MAATPTDEIFEIREQAYELALRVLDAPELRATLSPDAKKLSARLDVLRSELEAQSPATAKQWQLTVSEALQDLLYAQRESRAVSLRLGREIRSRR